MEFTGERFIPKFEIDSEISIFHCQRYESILEICQGKRVVDAACGEGYGTAMIGQCAAHVVGIDISNEAIENANIKYKRENIQFLVSSVTELPIESKSIDVLISFETIEHIAEEDQRLFFLEIKRVLKDDGILIMSSPDKKNYSDIPNFHNEFHVNELYFEEFNELITTHFKYVKFYYQGMFCNSYIYDMEEGIEKPSKKIKLLKEGEESRSEYIIAVCGQDDLRFDISSVIYDEFNKYYKTKDEVLVLKERLGNPGKIIEQKENYICEQREKLEELEKQNLQNCAIVEQKENYIREQREKLEELEKQNLQSCAIIEQKEDYICEQRKRIEELGKQNLQKGAIAEQKEKYICEQREKLEELEKQNLQSCAIIEQKEDYICEQREVIHGLGEEVQGQKERLMKLDEVLRKKYIGKILKKLLGE